MGGIGLETPVCTLGPQLRTLSRSSDPRALGLMHQQGEKWWRRPRTEKSHGLERVTPAQRWPRCPCGDPAAGTRCIPAHRFAPKNPRTLQVSSAWGSGPGGGGGQLGDKPTLFLKHSSRLGFRCSDLERWQMDPNWLLSRPGWGEARQQGFEGTSGW